jgi:hypothetical protein
MDALLAVIITLGGALLVVTAYMEWIGLLNIVTTRPGPRYADCGHARINPTSACRSCWRCRHRTVDHVIHPAHR